MGNTTLGAVTLQGDGKSFIANCKVYKEANLTPMPMYTRDSDETYVFDFGGVTKTIDVSGVYIGTDIADCATFITSCQNMIHGHQDVDSGYPISFVDDYRGTIKVKITRFESNTISGEPTIISWNFNLVESSIDS